MSNIGARACCILAPTCELDKVPFLSSKPLAAQDLLTWKPHIVHTLRLNPEAWLAWQALQRISATRWPKWVVSSWGSDINVGIDLPGIRDHIEVALQQCDGFITDCRRDLRLALAAGLAASKVALEDPVPVSGELNLDDFPVAGSDQGNRDLIVIPKAYEGPYNKTARL